MKVLFINTVFERSSTGRIIHDICVRLRQQGHDSMVIYGRYPVQSEFPSMCFNSKIENILHGVNTRLFDRHGFGPKATTKKIIETIKHYQPDIIHLHNIHGYYVNIKLLFQFLKQMDLPVVWTVHDCWPYTGHCVYYDYIGCDKWKTECCQCPKKREYPASYGIDNSKRNYNQKRELFNSIPNLTLVAVSDWLKEQLGMSFLKHHRIQRIYNGIDQTVFRPIKTDIKKRMGLEGKKVFLAVSDGWSERKGKNLLYQFTDYLNPDEVLIMVGLSEKDLKSCPKQLLGMGRTENLQQLVELYSAADIVLNPSYEETFGMITAEALSCGTPVIVSNATASPELVNSTCGRIIEKGNISDLRMTVDLLLENTPTKEQCLNRAKMFNSEIVYQEYINLYHSLMEE